MTDDHPNYMAIETPDDKPFEEFTTHERRSYLCDRIFEAGSPRALNQSEEAARFGMHPSTISRDVDRIHESVGDHIGKAATLRTASTLAWLTDELQDADDWRAKTALFDRVMRFNEWLADIGEQHREPDRSELDVDMDSRHAEVAYTVVREGDADALPTRETDAGDAGEGHVDYAELGFTSSPAEIPTGDSSNGEDPRGAGDE